MIFLDRSREPGAITTGLRGARRLTKERRLLDERIAGDFDFNSGYWGRAKPQLVVEAEGKCAYCEADTRVVAHGDVEHYRPKSLYWWLAYCYDNYVFACQICNQVYKSDLFPVAGARLAEPSIPNPATEQAIAALVGTLAPDPMDAAAVETTLATWAAELPDLPNPYHEAPERLFAWEADETLQEVSVIPADGSDRAQRAHRAAVEVIGLNREELRWLRYDRYDELKTWRDVLAALPADAEPARRRVEDRILRLQGPRASFAAMSRYFAGQWGLAQPVA